MLYHAIRLARTNVAGLLIEHGVNINERYFDQKTPLHFAAERGLVEVVQRLLERNADPTARDQSNKLPLDCAVAANQHAVITILDAYRSKSNSNVSGQLRAHSVPHIESKRNRVPTSQSVAVS